MTLFWRGQYSIYARMVYDARMLNYKLLFGSVAIHYSPMGNIYPAIAYLRHIEF